MPIPDELRMNPQDQRPPRTLAELPTPHGRANRRISLIGLLILTNVAGAALAWIVSSENPWLALFGFVACSGFLSPMLALLYIVFYPTRDPHNRFSQTEQSQED